jgi:hypothetical protein
LAFAYISCRYIEYSALLGKNKKIKAIFNKIY